MKGTEKIKNAQGECSPGSGQSFQETQGRRI